MNVSIDFATLLGASFEVQQQISCDQKLLVRGKFRIACLDSQRLTVRRIPTELKRDLTNRDKHMEIAPTSNALSFIDLILNASLLVQVVMTVLVLASLISWSMIFYKWFTLKYWTETADEFESRFWTVGT